MISAANTSSESYKLKLMTNTLPNILEYLEMINVGIHSVPDKYLCSLYTLIDLNLSHNNINNITQLGYYKEDINLVISPLSKTTARYNEMEIFNESRGEQVSYTTPILGDDPNMPPVDCSNSLQSVFLNNNNISSITSNALSRLQDLRKLDLDNNMIVSIAKDAFFGLLSLEYLSVANNHIVILHDETFYENKQLTKLFLRNNSINVLEESIFVPLTELQVLDLSKNKLKFSEDEAVIFNKLFRLVILDLSYNNIDSVWSSMFKGLSSLQRLDLSHNELTNLDTGCFSNMINLYELDISNNRLKTLYPSLFYGLVGLSSINLNNNSISNISNAIFQSVSNLRELHLKSNNLKYIPKALSNLSFLKTLDLSYNEISSISSHSITGLTNLLHLNLSGNRINNITSDAFKGIPSLLSLDLSNNELKYVEEGSFLILINLEYLKVASNNLTDIAELFAGMENLLVLDISQNNINMFDYAFLPRQLLELNLKQNAIKKVGNYYKVHNFLKLTKIDLSHNNLTWLKEISLPNTIEIVILNHNNIESIDSGTFHDKINLKRLDLSDNNLRKISPFSVKKELTVTVKNNLELLLAGNPLICDCEMSWLYSPKHNNEQFDQNALTTEPPYIRPNILDVSFSLCSLAHVHDKSETVTTIKVSDTVPENYLCPYATHCFALCHCCDYIACDCRMECPDSCSCFHDDTWTMNLVDCSHGNLDRLPSRVPMDATVVYLDGNNLKVLHAHHFIGRHSIQRLFLNSSNIGFLQNRTFHGLRALQVLHLHDNMIVHLNGFEFSGLRHLRELYLHNNRLSFINNATFIGLKSLEVLHIQNNFIINFPLWLLRNNGHLKEISFSNNPWDCSCQFVKNVRSWISEFPLLLTESDNIFCVFGSSSMVTTNLLVEDYPCTDALHGVTRYEFSQRDLPLIAGCVFGIVSVLIAAVLTIVIISKRKKTEANKLGLSTTVTTFSQHDEHNKLFDVYISYSARDATFVRDILVNRLEHTMPKYKVCLHSQDFAESALLGEFILQSISFSRRSIIILSKNYVDYEWKLPMFKSNHVNGFANRESSILTINYDGISESSLETSLKSIIRKTHKIKWGDTNFWKQIYELLPVRTPTPSMVASSPVYSGDPHYKSPLPSSISLLPSSTGGSNIPTDLSSPYRVPKSPKPCSALTSDYIVMQGRDCDDLDCSCKRHPTYAAVDDGSMHTYSSVDAVKNIKTNRKNYPNILNNHESSELKQAPVYESCKDYSLSNSNSHTDDTQNNPHNDHYMSPQFRRSPYSPNFNTLHPGMNMGDISNVGPSSLRKNKNKDRIRRPPSDFYADRNNLIQLQSDTDGSLKNSNNYRFQRSLSGPMDGPQEEQSSDYSTDQTHEHAPYSPVGQYFHRNLDKQFQNNLTEKYSENFKNDAKRRLRSTPSPVLVKYNSVKNSTIESSQSSHPNQSSHGHECFV